MSVIATALKHMLAAGMPADAIIEAIAEMEADLGRDPVAEKRRAYDRERKRAARLSGGIPVESAEITDNAENTPLPPPPLLSPQITPPPPTPVNITRARKGTRLNDDWQPTELTGQAAEMAKLWPPGAIERELAKFRNYWAAKPGKDGIKVDWQRTWVNWLISADERIAKHASGASTHTRRWIDPSKDIDAAARSLGFD